ncbi:MAG: outer membrane lipoprotein carrier protein LolA [Paracoccaceae bacterium]
MNMLRAALAPFTLIAMSLSAQAAEVPLDTLSSYLNSLTTVEAAFVQVNGDGSKAKGTIFIQRPGRARFEYAGRDKSLVLASGNMVAIFDAKSNQPPEQYPLGRTPLNLILAQNVDLSTAKMVIGHSEVGSTTRVVAQDPKHPDYGTIELVFSENPVVLTQWIITDDIGNQTSVTLGDLVVGKTYPSSTFSIETEMALRGR